MKDMIVKYSVASDFTEKKMRFTLGNKNIIKSILDNYETNKIGELRELNKFLDMIEITDEDKEIGGFKDNGYNSLFDLNKKDEYREIEITKFVLDAIFSVIPKISFPHQSMVGLSFIGELVDNNDLVIDCVEYKKLVEKDGKNTTEDIVVEFNEDMKEVSEVSKEDEIILVNILSKILSPKNEGNTSSNDLFKPYYLITLVRKIKEASAQRELNFILKEFYTDEVTMSLAELKVVDKYLEFE